MRAHLIAGLTVLLMTTAAGEAGARVTKDMVYGTAPVTAPAPGRADLLLDLYRPPARTGARHPVVVLIHGGGFVIGSRKDPNIVRLANRFVQRGIAVAAIDYRLTGQGPVPGKRMAPLLAAAPRLPVFTAMVAAADDGMTAIDYLKKHASRLGLDASRLGIAGASAGAITANHIAYVLDDFGVSGRPEVRFVGSLWGGIFLPPGPADQSARNLERGEPPLFAVHATGDTTVPVALGDALVAKARKAGVRTEYIRIEGGQHAFGGAEFFTADRGGGRTAADRLVAFARRSLTKR